MAIPDIVKRIGMIDAPIFVLRLLPTTTSDTADSTWLNQVSRHPNCIALPQAIDTMIQLLPITQRASR